MTTNSSCIFCRIIAGQAEASLVYQDALVCAFLDAHPVAEGHALVVPVRHASGLPELDDDSAGRMMVVGRRVAAALRRSGVRCEGINLLLADGAAAGQSVFHCHLHVIPRSAGDGFGFRRPLGVGRSPSRPEMNTLAGRIRVALEGEA
jgi:diadenosine tetraphosphate (Ap4A) HIT family hydrolase